MATEELNGILKEISALLHKQVEFHEASAARWSAANADAEKQRYEMAKAKRDEEMQASVTRSREQFEQRTAEERAFRERLLSVLDRQNQALEMILTYMKR